MLLQIIDGSLQRHLPALVFGMLIACVRTVTRAPYSRRPMVA